ncbi:MAG TPA: DUF6504 family protein [Thermomicrobiales bacterium]|nr:DUF6504 family protein [Thermomicrobiales bacterium]
MIPRRFAPAVPVAVRCDPRTGLPRRLGWRGRVAAVAAVEARWRWDEGWWRGAGEATKREYYRVRARDGLRCVVYRDLGTGRWYLDAIVD